jgi:hypothetical protein
LLLKKLSGEVPMGVDAPTKSLLDVLKFGLLGVFLSLGGLLFLAVGLVGDGDLTLIGLGAAVAGIGLWSLRSARDAVKRLRAISQA